MVIFYENSLTQKVITLQDFCILTWELKDLKSWIEAIKSNNIEKSKISFLEPEIEFIKFKNHKNYSY